MKQSIVVTIDGDIDYIKDYLNEGVNQWIISSVDIDDVAYDSDTKTWEPQYSNEQSYIQKEYDDLLIRKLIQYTVN